MMIEVDGRSKEEREGVSALNAAAVFRRPTRVLREREREREILLLFFLLVSIKKPRGKIERLLLSLTVGKLSSFSSLWWRKSSFFC